MFYAYVHLFFHFLYVIKIAGLIILAYFHDGLLSSFESNLGFNEKYLN